MKNFAAIPQKVKVSHPVNAKRTLDLEKGKLVFEVDLSKDEYPLSSTGKSIEISGEYRVFIPDTSIFYTLTVGAVLPK